MKLLTWMHRKFKQGSSHEILKDFPLGQAFLDDHQVCCDKQSNGRQSHRESQARKSFANLETTRMEHLEENTSAELSELFEGFLAIGTLGRTREESRIMSEPETPTFAVSMEKLAQGETQVTENELRLINDELERVLAIEANKEDGGWTDSSSRNSYVSNGRISYASTITLSGKPLEIIGDTQNNNNMICPLQEYLLGSVVAVECPDTKTPSAAAAVKKENRMSLGELFEKHKAEEICESNNKSKTASSEKMKDENKEGDKTRMNIVKKILKKKIAHAASFRTSSSSASGNPPHHLTSADTKLCKIMHKFQKKVHPENVTTREKTNKIGIKEIIGCNGRSYYKDENNESNIITSGYMQYKKQSQSQSQSGCIPNQFLVDDYDYYYSNNTTKECWIRTDADYLVLEL